jgi:hypothetical protein
VTYQRAEELIMHDLDYYGFVDMHTLKDNEYKIINEYAMALGKSEDCILEGRIEFYKEILTEAYAKGGTLFLTGTFSKYNKRAINNIETRLKELGEDLPENPGTNLTPAQGV